MKNMAHIFALVIALLASCVENATDIPEKDLEKYVKAYDYIVNKETEKPIYVSDTIVYLEVINFWEEIGKKDKSNLLILDSLDQKRKFDSFYSSKLAQALPSNKGSELSLYFSKIYDNYLLAELFNNRGLTKASYERIATMNQSKLFLFEFDSKGNLVDVHWKRMAYN